MCGYDIDTMNKFKVKIEAGLKFKVEGDLKIM
jgi:hypothetical protein